MQQYQIDFYLKLSATEQLILKAIALKSNFSDAFEITDFLMYRQRLTQKMVKECLEDALKYKLIEVNTSFGFSRSKYKASIPFMLYIYPELSDFDKEWQIIGKKSFDSYYTDDLTRFRNFLYCLLHDKKGFAVAQDKLLNRSEPLGLSQIENIFDYPAYDKLLSKINFEFLKALFVRKMNYYVLELHSINEIKEFTEKIDALIAPENKGELPFSEDDINFYSGKIELSNKTAGKALHYKLGVAGLIQSDFKTALTNFEKAIKLERHELKSIQLPLNLFYSFYYLTTLLCIDSEEATIRLQKMLNGLEKNSYSTFDLYFKAIIYNVLNNTIAKKQTTDSMFAYVKQEHNDLQSLLFICLCHLADAKPHVAVQNAMELVVTKAFKAGNLILAYEAAFAMKVWFNSASCVELYNRIAEEMSYKPVLSLISRQEDWEKSLNLLMNLGGDKPTKTAKDKEATSRVIYHFNPNTEGIQPILQTRNAKGFWSTGRNIALKTFFEAKTPGMTEQDIRVSKTLKHYNNYYDGSYYEFSNRAIIELVGHPYTFLTGGKEIPVELIAAQPEVKVVKSASGYSLSIDVKKLTERVFVIKETNTRYKVYDLSLNQLNIIRVLAEQKIVVPEHGKDKLIKLLGGISKHATVHSDLLTSTTENSKIKSVVTDNRVRVQLLPFGDGLKAELFAKPFGNHPPYCKPGVGGKVLIANENGVQLQVKRDLRKEEEYANALLADIQALESIDMSDDLIAFDEPLDSLHLLDVIANHKDKCVVEWPEGERFKIRGTANFGNLNLRIKSKTNWFELDGELKVNEDTVLTIQQLMGLVAKSHDRFIELKDGEFLALSTEMKKRLEELYTYTTSGKDGLHINKFASVALGDFFDDVDNLKTDKAWKDFQQRVENTDIEEVKVPVTLEADLRPYQEEGFRWMTRLAEWEGGACLADDMGLGKTIQTLAILLHRSHLGSALVICPVSVMGNWIAEAQRFAPTLNVKTLGTTNRAQTLETLEVGDLLVSSYGLLQSEEKLFIEKEFATIVLDEAHVIKNFATKTSKATMQLKATFRVALTGTPLQNHLGEIWNLFNFVNPGLLGSMQHFNDTFVKPDNEHARKYLRKLIAPFILRRTKSAVLDELPPKTEIVKKIQLSETEMAFYEALRRQAILNIESGEGNQGAKHLQVLAEITKLRQASCNPLLVDANVNIPSSKLATFIEIVDELTENKHRALVFSQFVTHLSIVRQALDKKGIKYQYLDGSTPIPERERSVKKFQGGEGELFLISLKAGGLGLNLTAADYVIHMDPWWNPAIEDQASDRAHRIGQTRPVTIYRLVAENTIEEKIIQLHNIKRDLAESLLEGSDQSARMSLNELVSLIQESL
jgi:superfamily II DNA or RNA helicase